MLNVTGAVRNVVNIQVVWKEIEIIAVENSNEEKTKNRQEVIVVKIQIRQGVFETNSGTQSPSSTN